MEAATRVEASLRGFALTALEALGSRRRAEETGPGLVAGLEETMSESVEFVEEEEAYEERALVAKAVRRRPWARKKDDSPKIGGKQQVEVVENLDGKWLETRRGLRVLALVAALQVLVAARSAFGSVEASSATSVAATALVASVLAYSVKRPDLASALGLVRGAGADAVDWVASRSMIAIPLALFSCVFGSVACVLAIDALIAH